MLNLFKMHKATKPGMKLLLDPYAKDPYGKASRIAMTEYANTIAEHDPNFAKMIYSTLADAYAKIAISEEPGE